MNNDLISRGALKKDFNLNFGGVSHAVIAARIIDAAPAVDDAAVRAINDIAKDGKTWMCPFCAHSLKIVDGFCYCELVGLCKMPYTKFELRVERDGERREDG